MIDRLNAMLEKYDELSNKLTSEEVLNNYEQDNDLININWDDYVIFFDQIKYTSNSLSYIFDGYELKDIEFGDSNDNSDEVSEAE